jgi:D-3-phosphoglycerate dehydrogenase
MSIIASDPYVSSQAAQNMNVELVDLNTLYARSDYITLHMALTPETQGMIGEQAFRSMKDGVRIINCARGELINTEALLAAMASGKVAGAGLDVFEKEPPADLPILQQESLVATPHIGGSTEEAQEIVGIRIVEQLVEYLKNGVALNAVNIPSVMPDQYREIAPYINLAERLGNFASYVASGNPKSVRLVYSGTIADRNTNLIRNAAVAGVLNRSLARKANLVNALPIASERGWSIEERHEHRVGFMDSICVEVETDSGLTCVEGAVILNRPRLISIDNIGVEVPLEGHLTFFKNVDVPGVIGFIGNTLGKNGVNIANFSLGRKNGETAAGGLSEAVAVVETGGAIPENVLAELLTHEAINIARPVEFAT